ncbi:MAG TPA: S41 family peptidase [Gemmatimonadaceae bacterium]|nr:S41 family peptidase [Gemmatimonadaceae bacterium]
MNRSRGAIALAVFTVALITGGWFLQRGFSAEATTVSGSALFDHVLASVAKNYVDSIPEQSLYVKAAAGMVDELGDPYSAFLPPDQLHSLNETTSGSYVGLGVEVDVRDGWLIVMAPVPGSPAEEAGIEAGDRVVSIDGQSTNGWNIERASRAIRGKPGTKVSLVVERSGVAERLPFQVVRRDIHVASARHPMMLTDRVGYVALTIFSDSSDDELRNAIGALRRRGMQTLLLDLRGNPGGLLGQGVGVSSMFLARGQDILDMRGRTPDATHDIRNRVAQLWPDLSVIVLVDGHTASAAEIVAGALQDHDRALIVGSPTYGKGVAQTIYSLGNDAGALKLTTARWFTPSGRSIQKLHSDTSSDNGDGDSAIAHPDTSRAVYHTDAGRTVYGGGGITPDVIVTPDTVHTVLAFQEELGAGNQRFRDALTETALAVKAAREVTSPDFTVTPAMRDALWGTVQAKHIALDRAHFDAAATQIDQLLGGEIAGFVFGPDAAFRRSVSRDVVVSAALELASRAHSEHDLLMEAAARSAKREVAAPRP